MTIFPFFRLRAFPPDCSVPIGRLEKDPVHFPSQQPAQQGQLIDYQNNLNFENDKIQESNNGKFNLQRRQAPSKGVQTKQAF